MNTENINLGDTVTDFGDTTKLVRQALSNINTDDGNGDWEQKYVLKTVLQEVEEMIIELNLKGSVRERSNGLIEFRNPKLGSVYGRTKEEISEKIAKKLRELQSHIKKPTKKKKSKTPLLSDFYRTSYLPYKQSKNKARNTIIGYESNMRYIVAHGFDKPLGDYTSINIEEFLYSIPQTRKRQIMQGFLNNLFNRAIAQLIIRENPCTPIEKMEHDGTVGTAIEFWEQKIFFKTLFETPKLSLVKKYYLLFVFLTGTRRNEALGVRQCDVDFERKVMHISGTKTDGSDRYIPLFPMIEKILQNLSPENGLYFPFSYKVADDALKICTKNHRLHDLRHTFGTIQICVENVNIKTVSLWLGHSNIQTTLKTYTHPDQLDKALFLRGDISEEEKIPLLKEQYEEILRMIHEFLG